MIVPDIICEKLGFCGVVTLNRPKALNALSQAMISGLANALDVWEHDPEIKSVLVKSTSEKAFCSGADIKSIYELGKAGQYSEQLSFLAQEYSLNRRIATYPKPYIALINGIVLGGGVGISIHGAYKIAGEAFSLAMPEVGMGFIPDVGASFFLPRFPGKLGAYLALTGAHLSAGDAVAFSVATAFVPADRHEALLQRLIAGEAVESAITAEKSEPPVSELMGLRHFVDGCFAPQKLVTILEDIDDAGYGGSMFAMNTYETILSKSPLSLAITLKMLELGAKLDLEAALRLEYRVAAHCFKKHDFYEGVRAALVDRDRNPQWSPASIEALEPQDIEPFFESLGDAELAFYEPATTI
jgi:enoyl-CoA hydratase